MGRRKAMTELLRDMMRLKLDGYMSGHGFTRRSAATEFRRVIEGTTQAVEMVMFIGPRYHPGAHAHIYPFLRIAMPEVNRIALEMVQDELILANVPHITLREPLEFVAPPGHRVQWYVTDQVSFMDLAEPIREFIHRWAIAFLDEYTTPEGVVRAYETGDRRTTGDGTWLIHVAACYVLLKRPEDAWRLLEERFRGIHTRREYAKAFDYVHRLLPAQPSPGASGG